VANFREGFGVRAPHDVFRWTRGGTLAIFGGRITINPEAAAKSAELCC
jgi:hypothetical protein